MTRTQWEHERCSAWMRAWIDARRTTPNEAGVIADAALKQWEVRFPMPPKPARVVDADDVFRAGLIKRAMQVVGNPRLKAPCIDTLMDIAWAAEGKRKKGAPENLFQDACMAALCEAFALGALDQAKQMEV
jgi:hypothetical protein